MRSVLRLPETLGCLLLSLLLLFSSFAFRFLVGHHQFANPRVAYGVHHAPLALLLSAIFTTVAGVAIVTLYRRPSLPRISPPLVLLSLILVFSLFWLPVWHSSGFVQDDWLLLAAASIRRSLWAHPLHAWYALDTVDGNFRPLGTVLYWTYLFPIFGVRASAYLAGNFLLNLGSVLLLFSVVRKLGYSIAAASLAALLFLSRGLLYTEAAWVSALGDCLVAFLALVAVRSTLSAMTSSGIRSPLLHLVAWTGFFLSLFAKQSSFTIPLVISCLLFFRPGAKTIPRPTPGRLRDATLSLALYGLPAVVVFLHSRSLLHGRTPYPIRLTLSSVLGVFSYLPWYLVAWNFPDKFLLPNILLQIIGLLMAIAGILLVRRHPSLCGRHPRDLAFLLSAAICSLLPFVVLPSRNQPYYAILSSIWASAALAILLTQYGPAGDSPSPARRASILAALLVTTGYVDVRLEQTGLIPAGGYVWGTSGVSLENARFRQLADTLAASPGRDTLVLVDPPQKPRYYSNMALLLDPNLRRIFVYDTDAHQIFANDHLGLRPQDGRGNLADLDAFHWSTPLDPLAAAAVAASSPEILAFDGTRFHQAEPSSLNLSAPGAPSTRR